jgi:hypothetical protein
MRFRQYGNFISKKISYNILYNVIISKAVTEVGIPLIGTGMHYEETRDGVDQFYFTIDKTIQNNIVIWTITEKAISQPKIIPISVDLAAPDKYLPQQENQLTPELREYPLS